MLGVRRRIPLRGLSRGLAKGLRPRAPEIRIPLRVENKCLRDEALLQHFLRRHLRQPVPLRLHGHLVHRARVVKPGGSVRGERANLKGLVNGCIEAKICIKICLEKLLPRSTQCTHLHRFGIESPKPGKPWGEKNHGKNDQ